MSTGPFGTGHSGAGPSGAGPSGIGPFEDDKSRDDENKDGDDENEDGSEDNEDENENDDMSLSESEEKGNEERNSPPLTPPKHNSPIIHEGDCKYNPERNSRSGKSTCKSVCQPRQDKTQAKDGKEKTIAIALGIENESVCGEFSELNAEIYFGFDSTLADHKWHCFSDSESIRAQIPPSIQKHGGNNGGSCGSCWSFSTTGALEGENLLATGKLESLSKQQLIDCDHECDPEEKGSCDAGCNGGLMNSALEYTLKAGGLMREKDYPYTATDRGTCKLTNPKL
ncbi:hypothetical protein L2E82_03681 [Cichorium intybus]|uniref:Uncharacterized protein n=1 Tax=Cichorium intybus TaxID=13427 RepID=A0ACB9H494_CICIN|nr:hypothetical protein L2E82_03681 [Cichorium intybus]